MGVFGKIGEAKYSEGGNYLKPGVYRLKTNACKYIKTRTAKDAFVVEFEVLASNNPDCSVGSLVSWMVTLDKEPALGNIKQFAMSVLACDEDKITEQAIEFMVSEANPCKDKPVRACAVNIMTKANRPFTKVKFIVDAEGEAAALAEQAKG